MGTWETSIRLVSGMGSENSLVRNKLKSLPSDVQKIYPLVVFQFER